MLTVKFILLSTILTWGIPSFQCVLHEYNTANAILAFRPERNQLSDLCLQQLRHRVQQVQLAHLFLYKWRSGYTPRRLPRSGVLFPRVVNRVLRPPAQWQYLSEYIISSWSSQRYDVIVGGLTFCLGTSTTHTFFVFWTFEATRCTIVWPWVFTNDHWTRTVSLSVEVSSPAGYTKGGRLLPNW